MNTINSYQLIKLFPPTKTSINLGFFRRSEGWLTNGYFAIREMLEPKSSKSYRFVDSDVKVSSMITKAENNITQGVYAVAEIANHFELNGVMLVKLQAEGREAWVNPRFLSYLLQGCYYMKNLKIQIGTDINNPVLVTDSEGGILGLVMPFRRNE
jgi:hypothetical protein